MKRLTYFRFIVLFLIFIIPQCDDNYVSPYDQQIRTITDEQIKNYIDSICLKLGGHVCLTAIGRCGQCGGMTPCCNMAICNACAAKRGVCPFCLKKLDWTKNTDPETEVPLLLTILKRSDSLKARQVALYALTQIKQPGTLEAMMQYSDEKMLCLELARAVGAFKSKKYINFLKKVLHYAGDDYFGDDIDIENIETQYYLSNAAQEAAYSLANIGTKQAINVLLGSAKKGKTWERYYAIKALGNSSDTRVKQTLTDCLKEFFKKNGDWKWIPGREFIDATLKSLSKVGDKKTALLVIHYIRNPGCDFLYQELKTCLSALGKPAVSELIEAIKEDFNKNLYDWGRRILVEALGDIGDPQAIPFLVEMLDFTYPDQWIERDFKEVALQGLGKLKAHQALDKICHELFNGKDETTRQTAARSLGQIGGIQAFDILRNKLKKSDSEWVVRECLSSLNSIAFNEIKTDDIRLEAAKITAEKSSYETAFNLTHQSILDEETWAIGFFFEILDNVPMQRNFYNVVELLNTNNKTLFNKTTAFLKNLTGLKIKTQFSDSPEKKQQTKQALYNWFQKHHQELK